MRVRHPYALVDGPPAPDARVHYGGRRETADIDEAGVFEVPDNARNRLESWAEGYGYELDELLVDEAHQSEGEDKDDELVTETESEPELCGTELATGGECERLADECPYHGDDEDD